MPANAVTKLTTLQRGAMKPPQFLAAINNKPIFATDDAVSAAANAGSDAFNTWLIDTNTNPSNVRIVSTPTGGGLNPSKILTYCGSGAAGDDVCLSAFNANSIVGFDPSTGFLLIRSDRNLASSPNASDTKLHAYPRPRGQPVNNRDFPNGFLPEQHKDIGTWYAVSVSQQ